LIAVLLAIVLISLQLIKRIGAKNVYWICLALLGLSLIFLAIAVKNYLLPFLIIAQILFAVAIVGAGTNRIVEFKNKKPGKNYTWIALSRSLITFLLMWIGIGLMALQYSL